MYQTTTRTIDGLLMDRGVSWARLSPKQKKGLMEAIGTLDDSFDQIGLKSRSKRAVSLESVTDTQTGEVYVCDCDTGEIIDPKYRASDLPVFAQRYPRQSRDVEELTEACVALGYGRPSDPLQESTQLVRLVRDKDLRQAEFDLLVWLIGRIRAMNYCLTTTQELRKELGVKPDLLSRRLGKLRKIGLVRIVNQDMHKKGDRLIEVNPVYAYRGAESLRDFMIRRWYNW